MRYTVMTLAPNDKGKLAWTIVSGDDFATMRSAFATSVNVVGATTVQINDNATGQSLGVFKVPAQ